MHSTLLSAPAEASTTPCSTEVAGIAARLLRQLVARGRGQIKETVSTLTLRAGSTHALPVTAGEVTIELLEGIVWLTRKCDTQDHVLSRRGQRLSGQLRQHIVLQPTTDARVTLKVRTLT